MKIDIILDLYVKSIFGAKFGRGNSTGAENDIDDKFLSSSGELIELKVVDEVGSGGGRRANKVVKCVQNVL